MGCVCPHSGRPGQPATQRPASPRKASTVRGGRFKGPVLTLLMHYPRKFANSATAACLSGEGPMGWAGFYSTFSQLCPQAGLSLRTSPTRTSPATTLTPTALGPARPVQPESNSAPG